MSNRKEARENITWGWETAVNDVLDNKVNLENVLKLIWDTYNYFYDGIEYNVILRLDLPIYRYVSEMYAILMNNVPDNISEYEYSALFAALEGLYWAIDTTFERGYHQKSLHAGVSNHEANYEIDMNDYDSYLKGFNYLVEMFHDMYDDGEYDEDIEEEN